MENVIPGGIRVWNGVLSRIMEVGMLDQVVRRFRRRNIGKWSGEIVSNRSEAAVTLTNHYCRPPVANQRILPRQNVHTVEHHHSVVAARLPAGYKWITVTRSL